MRSLRQAFGFHAETPGMWFSSAGMEEHGLLVEPGRYAVLHPGCSHPDRLLALDKWSAVAREPLAARAVERIVISAGPADDERLLAEALCGLIGPAAMATGGRLSFAQSARLLKDARLFLGSTPRSFSWPPPSARRWSASSVRPITRRARPWGTPHRVVRVDTTPFEGEAPWRTTAPASPAPSVASPPAGRARRRRTAAHQRLTMSVPAHYDAVIIGAGMSGLGRRRPPRHVRSQGAGPRASQRRGRPQFLLRPRQPEVPVGLHALTNWVPEGAKGAPLVKLMRQLRIRREELDLCPQLGSRVTMAGKNLRLDNDFDHLLADVAEQFPGSVDRFRALDAWIAGLDEGGARGARRFRPRPARRASR
jgi:hypothetical protein